MTLHIITYSTDNSRHKLLQESAELFSIKIHIIHNDKWNGYIDKLIGTINYINTLNDDDLVLFIDAYDVLLSGPENEILEKFYKYNCNILFSAELNCYPEKFKNNFDSIYPSIKNRYLNAGGYIGYVKYLKQIFEWKPLQDISDICKHGGDQTYLMVYYLNNCKNLNLKIDHGSEVFQSMHLISWDEIVFKNGRLHNTVMKSNPCFVHFNGGTWRTNTKENIMPIFLEKLKISHEDPSTLHDLKGYNQIITNTCYPHLQL